MHCRRKSQVLRLMIYTMLMPDSEGEQMQPLPLGQSLPKVVVSFGPTQSRIGPTKTGPKLRAKMPTVHRTANLLSCVGQRSPLVPAHALSRSSMHGSEVTELQSAVRIAGKQCTNWPKMSAESFAMHNLLVPRSHCKRQEQNAPCIPVSSVSQPPE